MPKLTKFKEKEGNNNLRNYIISAIILVGALLSFFIYKSYAAYKVEKKYDVIKARIGEFGMPSCEIVGNPTTYVENATLTIEITDPGKNGIDPNGYAWNVNGVEYSSDNTLTVTKNGTYVGFIKDTKGNVKTCSVTVDKIDGVTPTLTMLSGTYDKNDTSKIATATFGGTGGNVSCKNTSRGNNPVTNVNDINALGPNTITCTATGTNGKSVTKTSTIIVETKVKESAWTTTAIPNDPVSFGRALAVNGNGYIENNAIKLPYNSTQFGPYANINAGCYAFVYDGQNLNTSVNVNSEKDGALNYKVSHWLSQTQTVNYPIYGIYQTSNQVVLLIKFDANIDSIESSLINRTNTLVTIDRVWMTYYTTCPPCGSGGMECV